MTDFITEERYRNVKKMPALFKVDHVNHITLMEINPNAAWVFTEQARATAKKDGTSVTVTEDGTVYARRQVRKGKTAPEGFILAETDPNTGHQFGLEPIAQSGFYKMFKAAAEGMILTPGTWELVGPKINGNPEQVDKPTLLKHGDDVLVDFPDMRKLAGLTPAELYEFLKVKFQEFKDSHIEGIVWWGADGKRAKLRVKDFFGDDNR